MLVFRSSEPKRSIIGARAAMYYPRIGTVQARQVRVSVGPPPSETRFLITISLPSR
jgi:hypothetical protein